MSICSTYQSVSSSIRFADEAVCREVWGGPNHAAAQIAADCTTKIVNDMGGNCRRDAVYTISNARPEGLSAMTQYRNGLQRNWDTDGVRIYG
ncbi:hypothetical protein ACFE33_07110 [Falsihalocynthiibacter sp. SS001]|uniref:hypothetical protein n=1 Tax=Falsihalocynthiibacter sp. SS001 TaxID=3349698 RepID=UPI0036D22FE2